MQRYARFTRARYDVELLLRVRARRDALLAFDAARVDLLI